MNRAAYVLMTTVASVGVALAATMPTPLKLIWNVSASVPVGLYSVEPADALEITDLVAVMPPPPLAAFLIARGYLGGGTPLLKRVMGLPGQVVCRLGEAITVDGVPLGEALPRDRMGRDLPVWQGCRRVEPGHLFLMNRDVGDSLDGRYFGPISATAIIGRTMPVLTDEAGNRDFIWRAAVR
ncbi:Peptidase S26, conserved region [Ancylobacter novellus DSM 506]|uniref:Peptidase S26, conserved region n=1 Tax=Ancylobacter novellus (strain ATCC 8093 / DSM 506 / JCM 20403 / CCM 1077 / IAM 12100 / NBRC 12443 / NCIMB 10456) TaxID=639283 RepID=D7A6G8_ANCN5|nr:S26 family signal peptidase [Ancylobacter novellus]ADH90166.1 Peptidase S26, conserved region [Ancylobacter novellus DSM 506]